MTLVDIVEATARKVAAMGTGERIAWGLGLLFLALAVAGPIAAWA